MYDDTRRQLGQNIVRLHEELARAEKTTPPGMARPSAPGQAARSVSTFRGQRDAERIRAELMMAEERYRSHGGTDEYLRALADEVAGGHSTDGETPAGDS